MVKPVDIFSVASKQATWLTARQNAVSLNVANANTPNYKAIDVRPFTELLNGGPNISGLAMAVTNKRHMSLGGAIQSVGLDYQKNDEITASGNNVNLEQEVNRGAEIVQQMQFNSSIVKAFNNMYMSVLKR